MTKTIRLAFMGAAILALASPALARTTTTGERMTCHRTPNGLLCNSPIALQEGPRDLRAPSRSIYDWNAHDWNANAALDRASSPYAGGGS